MNRMMTLGDVIDAGNKGRDDRQRQEQYQRGLKQQQIGDGANARASEVFRAAMDGGEDRDIAMLRASEAYGQQFAEAGQWQDYLKHEAAVHPQRLRVRAKALQQFQMDKNPEKLLRTVYATVPDGNDIEAIENLPGGAPVDRGTAPTAAKTAPMTLGQVQGKFDTEVMNPLGVKAEAPPPVVNPGTPGDGRLGAPSGPAALRVRLKNGEVRPVDLNGFLKGVQQSLQDPVKSAEKEIELNFLRAQEAIKAARAEGLERVKGEETRKTEKVKGTFQADRDARQAADRRTLADINNTADLERTRITAAATTGAAGIRAGGGKDDDDGEIKTLAQANRAVETARNALNQATTAASKIRLDGMDGLRLTGEERAGRVDADPQVKAARAEYERALAVRNDLAAGKKPAAGAKRPPDARLNQFQVIR
jgi:hypothetical protein